MRYLLKHGIADHQNNIIKPMHLIVNAGTVASALLIGLLSVLCEDGENHEELIDEIRTICRKNSLDINSLPSSMRPNALETLSGCFDMVNKSIIFADGLAYWDVPGATEHDADRMYMVCVLSHADESSISALKAKTLRRAIRESQIRL